MFLTNGRTEHDKGIRFYEKDVILTKDTFTNDIKLMMDLDYKNPGFGIVLIPFNQDLSEDDDTLYLFRVGHREASVTMSNKYTKKNLFEESCLVENNNMYEVIFTITGNNIKLSVGGEKVIDININSRLDEYRLGVYSNKTNVIKKTKVESPSPDSWGVNMYNTGGGIIRFIKNGFKIFDCNNNAELEQQRILLGKGRYYLSFKYSSDNNIEPYVFTSDNKQTSDDKKNILTKEYNQLNKKYEYSFYLHKEDTVNLKFKGTRGTISNISMSQSYDDNFVIPNNNNDKVEGSYIKISTKKIRKVYFKGIIQRIPIGEDEKHYVFHTEDRYFNIFNLNINREQKYTYIIDIDNEEISFKIYNPVKEDPIKPYDDYINIKPIYEVKVPIKNHIFLFENLDGIIEEMLIIDKDNRVTDAIQEKTVKEYLQSNIEGPIILMNGKKALDMSSSYRKKEDRFIFTNYERETFNSRRVIITEKNISKKSNIIKLYGIKKRSESSKIFDMGILDNIDEYSESYDTFYENDLDIDKDNNRIIFEDYNNYKEIVVDYLKEDSYAINLLRNENLYEIDISTNDENIKMYYENNNNKKSYKKKLLNLKAMKEHYVVIDKNKEEKDENTQW